MKKQAVLSSGFAMVLCVMGMIVLGVSASAANADGLDVKLQEAAHARSGKGDYEKALDLYRSVLQAAADRPAMAVRALCGMCECFDRQGKEAEARKCAERMINEYPAELESSATARAIAARYTGGAATRPSELLAERLRSMIIPALKFREANIRDVVDYLANVSKELDPEHRGVNFIFKLERARMTSIAPKVSEDQRLFEGGKDVQQEIPLLTISLENISMYDAIVHICNIASLSYRIEDSTVIIGRKGMLLGSTATRVYSPSHVAIDALTSSGSDSESLKRFFAGCGVDFPEGTTIDYRPSINKLFVCNTEDNLDRIDDVIAQLSPLPKQITVKVMFIQVDNGRVVSGDITSILRKIAPQAKTGKAKLNEKEAERMFAAVETEPGLTLLATSAVTTKSGMNAETKIAEEVEYIAGFDPVSSDPVSGKAGQGSTNSVGMVSLALLPRMETRDVGAVLNVTPVIGPDGRAVDLTMIPQVVELKEWRETSLPCFSPHGVETFTYSVPVFKTWYTATSVTVISGETVMLSEFHGKNEKEPYKHLLVLVTVNVVDASGKIVR